jgi:hypothetical protein
LENLSDDDNLNGAWEIIKVNIKTSDKKSLSPHEMKQLKQRFDEECLGMLDQKKQTKLQWIQYPSQSNVDNMNNVRHDASRDFMNTKSHN